jgi:hypothetical protein
MKPGSCGKLGFMSSLKKRPTLTDMTAETLQIMAVMTVSPDVQWGFRLARRNRFPGREHTP